MCIKKLKWKAIDAFSGGAYDMFHDTVSLGVSSDQT